MASLKDVKVKIAGVGKTKQITKAMNMVASSKLRGAQQRIERFRPYAQKFYEMLADLASKADAGSHPLLAQRAQVKSTAIVVATSDRGLCGSFNANIISKALHLAKEKKAKGITVSFYAIGKKAIAAVKKTEHECAMALPDVMGNLDFQLANKVGLEVIQAFLTEKVDEVILVFGEFHGMARQVPVELPLLPIAGKVPEQEGKDNSKEYVYEPAVEVLLAELLPRFVKVQLYRGLLDTSASEHAARMAAMDNATRSCNDMISALTLLYNKTRQAAITRDLMDIVGGAEALNG